MPVKLYEVGGSIRDEIMGIPCDDRDYVAVCPEGWGYLLNWAYDYLDKMFVVTPKFFTIKGKKGNDVVDIVLARKDGAYSDGRRPDEVVPGDLKDDQGRRDFTCNSLARDLETGEIFDPFSGQEDIKDRILRFIGDPRDRIEEDGLRLLRAIRFYVTKGMALDSLILDILVHNRFQFCYHPRPEIKASDLLSGVSEDRKREELEKMFSFDSAEAGSALFGMELNIHPEILRAIFGENIRLKPTTAKK